MVPEPSTTSTSGRCAFPSSFGAVASRIIVRAKNRFLLFSLSESRKAVMDAKFCINRSSFFVCGGLIIVSFGGLAMCQRVVSADRVGHLPLFSKMTGVFHRQFVNEHQERTVRGSSSKGQRHGIQGPFKVTPDEYDEGTEKIVSFE